MLHCMIIAFSLLPQVITVHVQYKSLTGKFWQIEQNFDELLEILYDYDKLYSIIKSFPC